MKNKILAILRNRWFKFSVAALLYLLFVIWLGSYWLLIGMVIIYDLYISKKVRWAFWKPKEKASGRKKVVLEWVDAIIFAVVAATIIRLFFIEAYTIPTSSMEKTMMVGDYLFVSKVAYGPKVPNTPIAFPLVHHTLPLTKSTPSYVEWIKRPYRRLAGFGEVKRNDIVVFNFPEGDTVVADHQEQSYYYLCKMLGRDRIVNSYQLLVRPVDKRENYIKRCVGIPGDSILIVHGQVYVNGVKQDSFFRMQHNYYVQTTGGTLSPRILDEMKIPKADRKSQGNFYEIPFTAENLQAAVKRLKNIKSISRKEVKDPSLHNGYIFPFAKGNEWTEDSYGPIWIPKKGATVELNAEVLPFYERIISVYERHKLEQKDGKIFIDGEESHSYTFGMDYYWMMGDNRHNSLDSRFWGFVPEDHVVGRAAFVWLSLSPDKSFPTNVRWDRVFRFVH
ncbi:MAG: signal peptidase I [Prevotellaceae bacterium]|jgi:signal peptidase I|nr:signal peptidase I [Prevotellaceae bacterium]